MSRGMISVAAFTALCVMSGSALAQPIFITDDLSSNRFNALPDETLQVVTFYDGSTVAAPTLSIEFGEVNTGATTTMSLGPLNNFSNRIDTFEFDLNGYEPTCKFEISGVVPNGVIDGLAFGLLWKDRFGSYHLLKSQSVGIGGAHHVGAWPLGSSQADFEARTAQITDSFGREQARMVIFGAAYLQNGPYTACGYCSVLFEDDFETGGTSRWSLMQRR